MLRNCLERLILRYRGVLMKKYKVEITEIEDDDFIQSRFDTYKSDSGLIYVDYNIDDNNTREYFRGTPVQANFFVELIRKYSALEDIPEIDMVVIELENYLRKHNVD